MQERWPRCVYGSGSEPDDRFSFARSPFHSVCRSLSRAGGVADTMPGSCSCSRSRRKGVGGEGAAQREGTQRVRRYDACR